MNKEDIVRLIRKSGKPSAGLDEALTKKVPDFSRTFNVGGRNRTRTCDPIDVNDVLSAPATFVQEEDEFPVRLQSRSYKGFHGICTRVQLHPPDRVRFFICTRVRFDMHPVCTRVQNTPLTLGKVPTQTQLEQDPSLLWRCAKGIGSTIVGTGSSPALNKSAWTFCSFLR